MGYKWLIFINSTLLKINKIDSDIKYFYSFINNIHRRLDIKSISGDNYITRHNRYTHNYILGSYMRIIVDLKARRRYLNKTLRSRKMKTS